jgi:hypothetical protein
MKYRMGFFAEKFLYDVASVPILVSKGQTQLLRRDAQSVAHNAVLPAANRA